MVRSQGQGFQPLSLSLVACTQVRPLETLLEFESAIAAAVADRRLLVIKFYSASCRTCLSIKGLYESAAEGPLGERAHFYEVDTSCARVLCSLANIKKTPVRHTQCQRNPLG